MGIFFIITIVIYSESTFILNIREIKSNISWFRSIIKLAFFKDILIIYLLNLKIHITRDMKWTFF